MQARERELTRRELILQRRELQIEDEAGKLLKAIATRVNDLT